MQHQTLNLGILAHVDAGKTTLTERLLHTAGVIDELGSVDHGTTQTDSLELERQRGITIKSAVVSFAIDDVMVNLIDTPGHPDFIAEVERVLCVLDGAVLVLSAVEGVQAQSLVLMRALRRLRVPTLLFVNKIDRSGADPARVVVAIRERLAPGAVALGTVRDAGTRAAGVISPAPDDARLAEALADHDERLLTAYVEGRGVPASTLRAALAEQTARGNVQPLLFGSAATGVGVPELTAAIAELLPAAGGDADAPLSALVFKVERAPDGQPIAYARIFAGMVRPRDRVLLPGGDEAKVTAIAVADHGSAAGGEAASAGQIVKLWGLGGVRIGDGLGAPPPRAVERQFAPPTLEAVVVPRDPAETHALSVALAQLAEQDPLIDVRHHGRGELTVSLYGEVQKEVVEASLARDFGVEVEFRGTTTICVERPAGAGQALEQLGAPGNPMLATVGMQVEPGSLGGGVEVRLDVDAGSIPLYVFGAVEPFRDAVERAVRATLREGLCGWEVTDCTVILTHCGYAAPSTGARDYRLLIPLVLMRALSQAGTIVCEPVSRFRLGFPADTLGAILPALARLGAVPGQPSLRESAGVIKGRLAAAKIPELQARLRGLTRGEGALESEFACYLPVVGPPPRRARTAPDPLDRDAYVLAITRPRLRRERTRAEP